MWVTMLVQVVLFLFTLSEIGARIHSSFSLNLPPLSKRINAWEYGDYTKEDFTNFPSVPRVIPDLTGLLNGMLDGQYSKAEFVTNVKTGMCLKPSTSTTTFFYELGYDTVQGFTKQIIPVLQAINDTLGSSNYIRLIVYLRVNNSTKSPMDTKNNSSLSTEMYLFPNIELHIAIDLSANLYCKNEKYEWIKQIQSQVIHYLHRISTALIVRFGIAVDGELFNFSFCFSSYELQTNLNFVVFKYLAKWSTTSFSRTFFDVQLRNIQQWNLTEFFYHPTLRESCGCSCRLLSVYADMYDTNTIVEMPQTGKEYESPQDFFVIPHLNSDDYVNKKYPDDFVFNSILPIALQATSLGFPTLMLTQSQWALLNSPETKTLFKLQQTPLANIRLKILIDFSVQKKNNCNSCEDYAPGGPLNSWLDIEKELLNITELNKNQQFEHVRLDALVFEFIGNGSKTEGYQVRSDAMFVERMSTKFKMGCSFQKESFLSVNASTIVDTCKGINGSLYILKLTQTLQWRPVPYGINVRNYWEDELEAIKNLRNAIVESHPEASVYVQVAPIGVVKMVKDEAPELVPREILDNSLFCHPALQDVKRLFETIIAWANGCSLPLILNSALIPHQTGLSDISEWISFLRRYPHFKQKGLQRNMYTSEDLNYSFPISPHKYTTDACVEWMEERPEISQDYFNNNHIGTVLHIDDVRLNQSMLLPVYITMFQFTLHQFRLLEIVGNSNFPEILQAAAQLSKLESSPILNSTVFICFTAVENENYIEIVKFEKLLNNLKDIGLSVVKGIHIDIPEFSVTNTHLSWDGLIRGLEISKYAPFLSMLKEKSEGHKSDIKFGIVLHVSKTIGLIHPYTTLANDKNLELLRGIDYTVLSFEINVTDASRFGKSELQHWFDVQQYYKQLIERLFPNLEVYFRINAAPGVLKDSEKTKNYLRLLHHVKEFSIMYNLKYFIVEAFDIELIRGNGWWAVANQSDLVDAKAYIEKETVYSGKYMWYPDPFTFEEIDITKLNNFTSNWTIIGFPIGVVLLVTVFLVSRVLVARYKLIRRYLSKREVDDFRSGILMLGQVNKRNVTCNAESMKFDAAYELGISNMIIDVNKVLGTGNFGTVYKGTVNGLAAAIKQPNKDCSKATFKSFLSEIKVLCHLGSHCNVVRFLGAYTKEIQKGYLIVATELCLNGSLEGLLRRKKSVHSQQNASLLENQDQETSLSFYELHRYSKEIATGMEYIESKQVVHGDLSTRNVLLDENFTCKIGDFGLSRKLYEYKKYVKKSQDPLPWKWMAYESLAKMEFTSKSDVWSYGVTLWEIYSLGSIPYGGLNWTAGFADELHNGLRLNIPHFASEEIYAKIQECWHLDPEQRPKFSNLATFFKGLCDSQYTVL